MYILTPIKYVLIGVYGNAWKSTGIIQIELKLAPSLLGLLSHKLGMPLQTPLLLPL